MVEPTTFYFLTPSGRVLVNNKDAYLDGIRKYDLLAVRDSTGEEKLIHSIKTGWFDKKPRVFEDLFISLHFEIPFKASDEVVERLMELSKTDPIKAHERIAYITKQHEKRAQAAQAAQATSATDKPATEPAPTPQQPKEGNK